VACVHRQANAGHLQLVLQAVLLNGAESTDDNKKDCHSSSHCDKYRCLLMLEKVCNSVMFLLHVEAWFGFVPESLSQERISKGFKLLQNQSIIDVSQVCYLFRRCDKFYVKEQELLLCILHVHKLYLL
jgi:hypothetical protein